MLLAELLGEVEGVLQPDGGRNLFHGKLRAFAQHQFGFVQAQLEQERHERQACMPLE
ncbi:hypothetical protein D3C71_2209870 [compost metagenome]